MNEEITSLSARELGEAYRARELSPVEVVDAVLTKIEAVDPLVNAFVTVTADTARRQAQLAERDFSTSDHAALSPLHGVPVSVKDLEDTAGVRTTYGSQHFAEHVPDSDAVIWARLKRAGMILIGKTTTPEFGASGVTESDLTGITRNPWNLDRTAGGSSGGAAVAVAAGMGPIATGSDGGGSIRVPASFCGVVGLKASAGRIPFGSPDYAYEPVTVTGPLTRTVYDAALVLNEVHGPDPFDPASLLETGVDFTAGLEVAQLAGLRIAYSPDLGHGPVAAATAAAVNERVQGLEHVLGARVTEVDIDLPDPMEYFFDFWGPFIAVEQYEEVVRSAGAGSEAEYPLIERARLRSSLDFARTLLLERTQIHTGFAKVFLEHDLLVWPTTPSVAHFHPGERGFPTDIEGTTLKNPLIDNQRLTEAVSHAGYPAITVPIGLDGEGLPIGLQIAGRHGADHDVLLAAAAIEQAWPWSFPAL